jgi:hypothetical protein
MEKIKGSLTQEQRAILASFCFKLFSRFAKGPIGKGYVKYPEGTQISYPFAWNGNDLEGETPVSERYSIEDYLKTRIFVSLKKEGEKLILKSFSVLPSSRLHNRTVESIETYLGMTNHEIYKELQNSIQFMELCEKISLQ